jgi:hypothetical protein
LIESDYDGSGHFSDDEIDRVLRLRMRNLPPGVVVNEPLLTATVAASDRTLATVLALVRHMDLDHLPDHERVFRWDDNTFRQDIIIP